MELLPNEKNDNGSYHQGRPGSNRERALVNRPPSKFRQKRSSARLRQAPPRLLIKWCRAEKWSNGGSLFRLGINCVTHFEITFNDSCFLEWKYFSFVLGQCGPKCSLHTVYNDCRELFKLVFTIVNESRKCGWSFFFLLSSSYYQYQ